MWRQIGGYGDFSKKPIKVIHSSPLREGKSFLKGLFYFYGYSQTTIKSRNFIYFNHRGSGGFDMSNSLSAVHPELIVPIQGVCFAFR